MYLSPFVVSMSNHEPGFHTVRRSRWTFFNGLLKQTMDLQVIRGSGKNTAGEKLCQHREEMNSIVDGCGEQSSLSSGGNIDKRRARKKRRRSLRKFLGSLPA